MKLRKLSGNSTLLEYGEDGYEGKEVLFSYETPVAIRWFGSDEVFVTEKKFSKTTSKHINQYLSEGFPQGRIFKSSKVPQSWIVERV
jgi:hypothetical protein